MSQNEKKSEIKPPFKVFTSLDSVRLKSKSDSELVQENSVKFANFSKMNSSPNSEEGRIINAWNDLKQEAGIINKIKVSVSWVLGFPFGMQKNWTVFLLRCFKEFPYDKCWAQFTTSLKFQLLTIESTKIVSGKLSWFFLA